MRILFLDLDGVLHPMTLTMKYWKGKDTDLKALLENGALQWQNLLEGMLKKSDVNIVIHSSWRKYYDLKEFKSYFSEEIQKRILGVTNPTLERQPSIDEYLEKHKGEFSDYRIVDDYPAVFRKGTENLIIVDCEKGITDPVPSLELYSWILGIE